MFGYNLLTLQELYYNSYLGIIIILILGGYFLIINCKILYNIRGMRKINLILWGQFFTFVVVFIMLTYLFEFNNTKIFKIYEIFERRYSIRYNLLFLLEIVIPLNYIFKNKK
jgi:hypothetical protein